MDPSLVNRDASLLYPLWSEILAKAIGLCQKEGLNIYLFEGYRSYERSNWLYAQGRTRPGPVVTRAKAGQSSHNFGIAADLVFDGNPIKPGMQWTWNGDYLKVATIIKASSPLIEWAGDWKSFREMPHFQLKQPYSVKELDLLYTHGGLKLVFSSLDQYFKSS